MKNAQNYLLLSLMMVFGLVSLSGITQAEEALRFPGDPPDHKVCVSVQYCG